jgi:hypothetical protein
MLDRMLAFLAARAGLNPLEAHVSNNTGRQIDKWQHYLEIYHRHFAAFRGRRPVVVEIGAQHGGSLQMWKRYFGAGARIVGVDIDPRCRDLAEDSIEIVIGDQADRAFHAELRRRYPRIDILIDDGGHTMTQLLVTFEELYPHVQPDGVYLCEDLSTCYAPGFGGGLRRDGTFIERAKLLIDSLHGWWGHAAGEPGLSVDDFTRSAFALHFYDSMLVIEKRPRPSPPRRVISGKPSFLPE